MKRCNRLTLIMFHFLKLSKSQTQLHIHEAKYTYESQKSQGMF